MRKIQVQLIAERKNFSLSFTALMMTAGIPSVAFAKVTRESKVRVFLHNLRYSGADIVEYEISRVVWVVVTAGEDAGSH